MIREVGVKALIPSEVDPENLYPQSYLFIRRQNGNWDIPGGRLHPGETRPDGLDREVHEETGLCIVRSKLKLPRFIAIQPIRLSLERCVLRYTYIASAVGKLAISTDEHTGEYTYLPLIEAARELSVDNTLKELPGLLARRGISL